MIALLLGLGACSGGERTTGPLKVSRTIHGDTEVVRTRAGSVWGAESVLVPEVAIEVARGDSANIAALAVGPDGTLWVTVRSVPEVRAYSPDGTLLRTLGGPSSEAPLSGPDGGLVVLSDGRVLVRDPGDSRIHTWDAGGKSLHSWYLRTYASFDPLHRDRADNVYTPAWMDPPVEQRTWIVGLQRFDLDGHLRDTLRPPASGYQPPMLRVRNADGVTIPVPLPFGADEAYTLHPDGYLVHGIGDEYRFTLLRPGRPLVVERVAEPAPVSAAERSAAETVVRHFMRRVQPDWEWSGPEIPEHKAFFRRLNASRDGRIWVEVPLPGVEVPDPGAPDDPESINRRWRQPFALDVFESDGTYLGRVRTPLDMVGQPVPVFEGDRVWGLTIDEGGVRSVVRFRVERGGGATP